MPQPGTVKQVGGLAVTPVVQLVGASDKRLSLSVSIDSGVGYITDRPQAGPGTGFVVTPSAPVHLRYADYGDIVRHSWFGSASVNTALFGVLETHDASGPGA